MSTPIVTQIRLLIKNKLARINGSGDFYTAAGNNVWINNYTPDSENDTFPLLSIEILQRAKEEKAATFRDPSMTGRNLIVTYQIVVYGHVKDNFIQPNDFDAIPPEDKLIDDVNKAMTLEVASLPGAISLNIGDMVIRDSESGTGFSTIEFQYFLRMQHYFGSDTL